MQCKHISFWDNMLIVGIVGRGRYVSLSKGLSLAPLNTAFGDVRMQLCYRNYFVSWPEKYVDSRHVAHTPAVVSSGPRQNLPEHSSHWCGTSDHAAGSVKGCFRRVGSRSHSDRWVCRCIRGGSTGIGLSSASGS